MLIGVERDSALLRSPMRPFQPPWWKNEDSKFGKIHTGVLQRMRSSDLSLARSSFSANALFPSEINGENVVFQLCPFPSVRPAQISAPPGFVVAKNSSSLGIFSVKKKSSSQVETTSLCSFVTIRTRKQRLNHKVKVNNSGIKRPPSLPCPLSGCLVGGLPLRGVEWQEEVAGAWLLPPL